jgi:hypothetical protein
MIRVVLRRKSDFYIAGLVPAPELFEARFDRRTAEGALLRHRSIPIRGTEDLPKVLVCCVGVAGRLCVDEEVECVGSGRECGEGVRGGYCGVRHCKGLVADE